MKYIKKYLEAKCYLKMGTIRRHSKYSLLLVLILLLVNCSSDVPKTYPDGTTLENITWRVPLKDSLNIITKKNGEWLLPEMTDTASYKITYTYFRKARITKYQKLLGKIDQEEVSSSDTNIVRFYRIDNSGRALVGYTTADTAKPLTIFDPPVIIQPADFNNPIVSSSLMKTLKQNKFDEGLKTTVTINPKEKGSYIDESGQKKSVTLYNLTFTRDAIIQYGENNLIVPDAVSLSSDILAGENGKLLLEWGIRRVPTIKDEENRSKPDSLYIEVTKYKIIK